MTIHLENRLAHRVGSDAEAIETATRLAARFGANAAERDRGRILPWPEVEQFSQSGLWAITVPRQYGGAEVSVTTLAKVVALISAADPSLGQLTQNHYAGIERLRLHGSEEQKEFFFGRMLAGDRFGNATAEPGDKPPRQHQTRVENTADGLCVTGSKVYSTGALFAHWVPVSAIDDAGENVTAYVARNAPGLDIRDDWTGFGQRTTASGTVVLDHVPVESLQIFRNGKSKKALDTANAVSQIVHAAIDLGIARAALDDTLDFLRRRSHAARGSGIADATSDPLTLRDIGAGTVAYHGAEALTERAARLIEEAQASGQPADAARALIAVVEAKIATTEVSLAATNKLFELAGTQSTLEQYGLDRHWRNARTHTLHDGVRWKYHAVGQFELNGLLCDPWTLGHPYSPAPEGAAASDQRGETTEDAVRRP